MFFSIKHFLIFNLALLCILSSCKLQEPNQSHGIVFLENRAEKLTLNKSNKNDVIRIIGFPQIKDENNDNNWIYLERILTKGKYHELGRHKLKNNNVLVLSFNKYGILDNKEFFTKEELNKIQFSKEETENDITKKSFVQSFLQSIKQKMYGGRNSN